MGCFLKLFLSFLRLLTKNQNKNIKNTKRRNSTKVKCKHNKIFFIKRICKIRNRIFKTNSKKYINLKAALIKDCDQVYKQRKTRWPSIPKRTLLYLGYDNSSFLTSHFSEIENLRNKICFKTNFDYYRIAESCA